MRDCILDLVECLSLATSSTRGFGGVGIFCRDDMLFFFTFTIHGPSLSALIASSAIFSHDDPGFSILLTMWSIGLKILSLVCVFWGFVTGDNVCVIFGNLVLWSSSSSSSTKLLGKLFGPEMISRFNQLLMLDGACAVVLLCKRLPLPVMCTSSCVLQPQLISKHIPSMGPLVAASNEFTDFCGRCHLGQLFWE